MLLEIRMLTQSFIWLHRSKPWEWNHINTNNVRYKVCSSLYLSPPSFLFSFFYTCFSVSADLNLNNQLSSWCFNREGVQCNEGSKGNKIAETEGDWRMWEWDEIKWSKSVFCRCFDTGVWVHTVHQVTAWRRCIINKWMYCTARNSTVYLDKEIRSKTTLKF